MKTRLREQRADFRGGRNTKVSPDLLNANEFVDMTNIRLTSRQGGWSPRLGTRRMHTTAFGDAVVGLVQWIPEGGAMQLVAVADTDIHYKTTTYGAFTTVGASLSGDPTYFATARENTSGAPLRLYLASQGLYRWTGTALTSLSGSNGIPNNVDMVRALQARLFMHSTDYMNSLFWTDQGNPEAADGAGKDGGGSSIINVLGGEYITALETLAGALLIGTQDTVAVYEGYSDDDIQIAQDTEGLSDSKGPLGPLCFARDDKLGFMFSADGVSLVTKERPLPLSLKIEPDLLALDRTLISSIPLGIHKGRRELWVAAPGADDAGLFKTIYVYSIDLQAWSGPFTYSFGITCLASYEDANGDPTIIAGCSDGFVRNMDTGFLDDVLADGSGGSTYIFTAEPAPFFFPEAGPEVTKTMHRFSFQADLGSSQSISVKHGFDGAALTTETLTGEQSGRVLSYRVDATANQGERLRLQLTGIPVEEFLITGITAFAFDMLREV